jgi:hypothetical protein
MRASAGSRFLSVVLVAALLAQGSSGAGRVGAAASVGVPLAPPAAGEALSPGGTVELPAPPLLNGPRTGPVVAASEGPSTVDAPLVSPPIAGPPQRALPDDAGGVVDVVLGAGASGRVSRVVGGSPVTFEVGTGDVLASHGVAVPPKGSVVDGTRQVRVVTPSTAQRAAAGLEGPAFQLQSVVAG